MVSRMAESARPDWLIPMVATVAVLGLAAAGLVVWAVLH